MIYILAGLLFFVSFFSVPFSYASDPNIVIINSYHYGQEWADRELSGVLEALREKYPGMPVSVEYLDTKRFRGRKHMREMTSFLAGKYAGRKPDLVIALDNPALDLLLACRAGLFSDSPIVFAGINNYSPSMLKGHDRITGIAEVTDIRYSIETIMQVNPGTKHIVILNDYTVTGLETRREMERHLDMVRGNVKVSFVPPMTFEEMQQTVNDLPEGAVALIASLITDSSGKTMTIPESTRMITSGNRIPVYSTHETLLGHGVLGGNMRSGVEHGRKAGHIALRILAGENPSAIPVDTTDHSAPIFDYVIMQRLGIPPDRLPPGSIVINRPVSFYERHETPILFSLVIIIILLVAIIILNANVIKRKRAEKTLLELSRYKSALFEEARDAIFVADAETELILDMNREAERLVKRPRSELIGLHVSMLSPAGDEASKAFRQICLGACGMANIEISAGDGGGVSVEIRASIIECPGGSRMIMGICRDVSERTRLQEQLINSQKMEAVGTLAGGVAHEFNNALTAIIGAADILRLKLLRQSRPKSFLNIILNSSLSAARLTKGLLSFCRKQISVPQHVDINKIMELEERLFSKIIGEDILVVKELSEEPCVVIADPGQMEQIIINIVLNARDAMPNGGSLEIRTEQVSLGCAPACVREAVRPGDYVVMSFKDSGCGIDAAALDKIFEPFFTTKEAGRGSGLGLSIVYGLVRQNNGFIGVKTEIGCGTEFRVFLPSSAHHIGELSRDYDQDSLSLMGAGTILLAEDNEAVRHMQSLTLKNAGYDVIEAGDGKEAVELFGDNSERINIVMLDVVMPLMSGKEACDEIKKSRPWIKVLLVSGHTDEIIAQKGIERDKVDFLAKPYTPAQLLIKIREMTLK
jgi:two-component system, cell cycle sensor histidine kinase and response regulator CckA